MDNFLLNSKFQRLPENLKSEVVDFIDFLLSKSDKPKISHGPKFGSGKGMFVMKEDFDDPLDDFKEYMH